MKASIGDYVLLHVIVFLWGTTAVISKLVSVPATEMLFFRTLAAAIGLLVLALATRTSLRASGSDLLKMLGIGFIVGIHWVAFFVSAQITTVSISLIGFATCSLWAAILEPIVNKQRIRGIELFLGVLVLSGLYIIFHFEFRFYAGLLLSVLSGFLAAVFSVMNFHLVRRTSATSIAFWEMTGAFLLVTAFLPVYRDHFAADGILRMSLVPMDWLYIGFMSIVCSVFAFTMSVQLMKKVSVFTVQLTLNLEPVYGIFLALMVLGEGQYMGWSFIAGAGLIMSAVLSYPLLKNRFT
ncbi:MAG: DMT family transporter [Bacteroidota bacterium]